MRALRRADAAITTGSRGGGDSATDPALLREVARRRRSAKSSIAGADLVVAAQVVSHGPVKELCLFDRGRSGHGSLEGLGTVDPSLDASAGGLSPQQLRFEASFQSLGLTLIDEEPSEVLHVVWQDLTVRATASVREHALEVKAGHLQLDSCVRRTRFQVMLTPQPPAAEEMEHAECLQVIVSRDPRWESMMVLHYVGAHIAPLRLDVEQNTITRLMRLLAQLTSEWERAEQRHRGGAVSRVEAAAAASSPRHAAASAEHPTLRPVDTAQAAASDADGPRDGHVLASLQEADVDVAVPAASLQLYIKELHLEPVLILATISIAPLCDEPDLQEYHPTNALRGPLKQLTSLQSVSLGLHGIAYTDLTEDADSLAQRLVMKYVQEVVLQLHKLLGSLDLIGNPAALFSDVRGGVRTFLREPRRGTLRSPSTFARGLARGTAGLAGGVGGGFVSGFSTMFSAGSKGVGLLAMNMSGDAKYARRRQLASQQRAQSVREGFSMGTEALKDGLSSAMAGLIKQPVRGAMHSGARGAVRGAGLGLAGVFPKAVSGLAGFASKVSEGVGASAKRYTPGAVEAERLGRLSTLRVRQPRVFGDRIVRFYPRDMRLHVIEEEVALEEEGEEEDIDHPPVPEDHEERMTAAAAAAAVASSRSSSETWSVVSEVAPQQRNRTGYE